MRLVVQRVRAASVSVSGKTTASIGPGLLVLVGVQSGDTESDVAWLTQKIATLRVFEDASGKMNESLLGSHLDTSTNVPDVTKRPARGVLVVSQFTLLASTRKGTRPSFNAAASPELAEPLYERFVQQLGIALGSPVQTGTFGAAMQVTLTNDGPVTLVMDSRLRE